MRASFIKISRPYDGWGVRVDDYPAGRYAGHEVEVSKRDGSHTRVRLGARIELFNGGRAAYYTIDRKGR